MTFHFGVPIVFVAQHFLQRLILCHKRLEMAIDVQGPPLILHFVISGILSVGLPSSHHFY